MSQTTFLVENWRWLAFSAVSAYVGLFVFRFVQHRRFFKGLPSPEHSFLLGNLKVMGEAVKNYPADAHPQAMFTDLGRKYNFPGIYYMDLFPFSESFVLITDPAVAAQVQAASPMFHRHPFVKKFLKGMVGTKSIFSTQGTEWQRQRSWFAPAFSMTHLLTLVPGMIEETLVFKEKITKFAVSGEVFSMNDQAIKLTIDVIARSVGNIRLKSQTEYSPIQNAFEMATYWTAGLTDPRWKKIVNPFFMWWHTRRLDSLLGDVIKEKYSQTREDGVDKSILDLALKGYLKDNERLNDLKVGRADLDKDFMRIALDNAKTFLVGGHDTTSSLVTYTFYLLSTHPEILGRVREEHDQVLGTSLERTAANISAEPALLNKLPLTLAVFKEVLRLHPVGFTVRGGKPGATVTYEGRTYPMDNDLMIATLTSSFHRDPKLWPNPNDFEPDRFLKPAVDESGAWQPFEKGPRNCIGQQLALLEAKVIMSLTLRYFDLEAAFKSHGFNLPGWGGKAYQELKLTAKPKDGIPMRAKVREAKLR